MANTIMSYTDGQIMRCLLTHDFTDIGGRFTDDVITRIKTAAFYGAANLDKVSLASVKDVGAYAFYNAGISSLELPWEELESIGANAFYGASAVLPMNPVFSKLVSLGSGAFAGTSASPNTQLRTVSFPLWTGSSPSVTGITGGGGIFAYCTALTSISAPLLTSVTSNMFLRCTALEEVVLPKASSIGSSAFDYCSKLTKIDIGGAATSFSFSFLSSNSKLEAFILRGVTSVPTLGSDTFSGTNIAKGSAYVYVPKSLEATFKVTNNWSTYAEQIRAIEDYPGVCGP